MILLKFSHLALNKDRSLTWVQLSNSLTHSGTTLEFPIEENQTHIFSGYTTDKNIYMCIKKEIFHCLW